MPLLLLLLVRVTVMVTVPSVAEGHTTCTAVTTIYTTTVTCLFGQDIADYSFNVQFFYPNISATPEIPLVCNRLRTGALTCQKHNDVTFDEKQTIRDRFTLTRPSSLDKLGGGHYQCQRVSSQPGEVNSFCSLTYQDVPRYVPMPELSTITSQRPTQQDEDGATKAFVMVAVIIFLMLVIVLIIAATFLYLRRERVRQWWTDHTVGRMWPGTAVEDPTETDPHSVHDTRIPDGLPSYFYNLGWTEATKGSEENARQRGQDVKPSEGWTDVTKESEEVARQRGQDVKPPQGRTEATKESEENARQRGQDVKPPKKQSKRFLSKVFGETKEGEVPRDDPVSPEPHTHLELCASSSVAHGPDTNRYPHKIPGKAASSRAPDMESARRSDVPVHSPVKQSPYHAPVHHDFRPYIVTAPLLPDVSHLGPAGRYTAQMEKGATAVSGPEEDIFHPAVEIMEETTFGNDVPMDTLDPSSPMLKGQHSEPAVEETRGDHVESKQEKKAREKAEKKAKTEREKAEKERAEKEKKEAAEKTKREKEEKKKAGKKERERLSKLNTTV